MNSLLWIGLLLQTAGGLPGYWQLLSGVPDVSYRWSRPTSDSCSVEFRTPRAPQERTLNLEIRMIGARPGRTASDDSDNSFSRPSVPEKPKVVSQSVAIELSRDGQARQYIHSCYGIVSLIRRGGNPDDHTADDPQAVDSGNPR